MKHMLPFLSSLKALGLERSFKELKTATLVASSKTPSLLSLEAFPLDLPHVKRLYIDHPILTTALEGTEVFARSLTLPLIKEKDLDEALPFQAEPLLPYPVDQALFSYQVLEKGKEETSLSFLSVTKEILQTHLETWKALGVEPEKVGAVPTALCQFSHFYLPKTKLLLVHHINHDTITSVFIKEGKLIASFALQEGLSSLLSAQKEDELTFLPEYLEEWQDLERLGAPKLAKAVKKLQQTLSQLTYSLLKELKGEKLEGILLTGEICERKGLSELLLSLSPFPLLQIEASSLYSSEKILSYAVPIGLATEALSKNSHIDFRQQDFAYPYPWSRLKKPLAISLLSLFLLTIGSYFFGQQYLAYQEDRLRQTYADLLAGLHQSPDQLELSFLAKNPSAKERFKEAVPSLKEMKTQDLNDRLVFLQKELQGTPDSFPLFADIPRVSDVLAWLAQHPAVTFLDEEGKKHLRLQIENFNYTLVKRPQYNKKQEKYQVKVELEFSSPTPKWAREFHDALISSNDWVDPKGEVKWNSSRGKYKTSFFLKDKTYYPN